MYRKDFEWFVVLVSPATPGAAYLRNTCKKLSTLKLKTGKWNVETPEGAYFISNLPREEKKSVETSGVMHLRKVRCMPKA